MAAMFGWLSDGEDFGFALEAGEPLGIARKRVGQHLDRDVAIELRVGRPIHLAHAARADRWRRFHSAEAGARAESHGKCL